jgi:energy-coupling factor transporter ATP-binding protein EcfA2/Fe-S cluster assembly ATPase SufC
VELKRFRVTTFRSVEDSGWIEVERVAALIGVNESGKTNLLLPLWKLNPAREGEIQPTSDYPKKLFGTIRADPGSYCFISAEFETGELASFLAEKTGHSRENLSVVRVSRYYDREYTIDFPDALPIREKAAEEVRNLLDAASSEIAQQRALKAEETLKPEMLRLLDETKTGVTDSPVDAGALKVLQTKLKKLNLAESGKTSLIVPRYTQVLEALSSWVDELTEPDPEEIEGVLQAVINALPKFVYYSNYGNLDSEIYLPHVVENLKRQDLGNKEAAKVRTLRVLFNFVRLSPEEILELGQDFAHPNNRRPTEEEIHAIGEKKRERSILLQSASTLLTQEFRQWWKQGDYRFRFEADGNHFRIWVADDRRPEEIELESRSTGLQWFLSFYLVFLVESQGAHRNAMLLLDEPGLSLHPLAQRDLSAFFEGLAGTNQLIYTTHSPFLVDADHLERVRKVFVAADGTTRASENLRESASDLGQPGAAYAVHSALNLTIAESLLLGCQPIIVEGPSDQHYLTAIKTLLIREGRFAPRRELVFPPSGGAKTARLIASILTGRDDELPLVLLDDDAVGRKMAQEMRTSLYQEFPDRVLNVAEYARTGGAEVEDLFPTNIIAESIDRMYRVSEQQDEFGQAVKADSPVVPQIEEWARQHDLTLEKGWKVQLAKRVKQQLLSRGVDRIEVGFLETWVKLFSAFAPHSR